MELKLTKSGFIKIDLGMDMYGRQFPVERKRSKKPQSTEAEDLEVAEDLDSLLERVPNPETEDK